jgi:tetratricopeptide (TPR) repeat protein
MIRRLTGGALLALAACATASAPVTVTPIASLAPSNEVTKESLLALNSICRAETPRADLKAHDIKLIEGMGTGGFKVDSTSKPAQDWFNYGLALSHAFYHQDAKRAMKKSVEADPSCSLCAWGEAWALGPTLNYGIDDKQRAEAKVAADKALSLVKPGDEKARRLAEAIVARYQPNPKSNPELTFGPALKTISESYPDDIELAVLATHSLLMPVRSGDTRNLKPALAMLEDILKKRPNDTGAIHYYIHATEFDDRPEDALPYADKLGQLAPAASHLVHMPAHTFFHAGRYHDAAVVNAQAIGADKGWLDDGGDAGFPGAASARMVEGLPPYYAHNLAFGLAGALMSGDAQLALKYAEHAQRAWPDTAPVASRAYPVPRTWVALARYAPDKALAVPEITGDPRFAIYRAYARGEAFLQKGDVAGARAEVKALGRIRNAGGAPELIIARTVLEGRIAMSEGNPAKAARLFDRAARIQESRLSDYWDPPSWWYPVRRSAAAAYLKAGDFAKAQTEAEKSLAVWKHDPMALWVKGRAQIASGKTSEGEAALTEARKLWRGDFASITADAI